MKSYVKPEAYYVDFALEKIADDYDAALTDLGGTGSGSEDTGESMD